MTDSLHFCVLWVVDPSGRIHPGCVSMTYTHMSPDRARALLLRNQGSILFMTQKIDENITYACAMEHEVTIHPNQRLYNDPDLIVPLNVLEYAHFREWQRRVHARLILCRISANCLAYTCQLFRNPV
jgi:hypothetical protein